MTIELSTILYRAQTAYELLKAGTKTANESHINQAAGLEQQTAYDSPNSDRKSGNRLIRERCHRNRSAQFLHKDTSSTDGRAEDLEYSTETSALLTLQECVGDLEML